MLNSLHLYGTFKVSCSGGEEYYFMNIICFLEKAKRPKNHLKKKKKKKDVEWKLYNIG